MIHFPKHSVADIEATLAHQKTLASGSYNFDALISQLAQDFHRKCYICESKVTSIRIEHFRPQCLGLNEKFDWFNIFNACEHCNAIKSDDYKQLIDCTKECPDQHIKFEVVPLNPIGQQVVLSQLLTSPINQDTIALLRAVYAGTNNRKRIESEVIVEDLLEELNDFEDLIQDYLAEQDEDDLEEIKFEINNASKFTAFKRWLVRSNNDYAMQFSQYFIC